MSIFDNAAHLPRYQSLFELEQRGCARSYLAIDHGVPAGARLVVVHVVPPSLSRDCHFVSLFAARAAALVGMNHPNLVRTLDFVAEKGQRCQWVSEFIQGHTLGGLLAKSKRAGRMLTLRQHLTILCDVLRGLEHAHRLVDAAGKPSPIVHRHLSPSSVLVSYDGNVKVTDATLHDAPMVTGRFDGEVERLAYRAPECCLGANGDPRSDVFAVGALLWEAVCQRPRPVGSSIEEALEMCRSAAEPEFDGVDSGVSPTLAAITRRALARDPGERYQSARELRLGIEAQMPPLPASRERGSLFAFMCSHFYEEHEALQRLLESRAPGALDVTCARETKAESRTDPGADTVARTAAEPVARAIAPSTPLADPRGRGTGSSRGRRVRQGALAVSFASVTLVAVFLVRPEFGSQRATESVVQHLRSPSASPQRPAVAQAPPRAPVPLPSPAASALLPDPAALPAPASGVVPVVIQAVTPRAATSSAPAGAAPAPVSPVAGAPAVTVSPAARVPAAASDPSVRSPSGVPARDPPAPAAAPTPRAVVGTRADAEPPARARAEPTPPPRTEPNVGIGADRRSLQPRAPLPIDEVDPYGP